MSTLNYKSKTIAKNTILLYLRTFITMFISLYTSRVVLSTLGVSDYGLYNIVGGFVAMFSLVSSSLTTASQRFITFELGKTDDSHPREIFATVLTIQIFISLVIVLLAETIGLWFVNFKMNIPTERVVAANWLFQFSMLTFILNLISVPYNASIVAHEKMSAFAYITLIEAFLKLLIVYCLQFILYDKLIIYGLLMLFVAFFIRFLYANYCNRKFEECKFMIVKNKNYYRSVLGFSGWNIIGSTGSVLNEYGVNVLLNLFFGVTVNAARGLAVNVNSAVNQFVSNFTMAINPQITKSYASGEHDYMMNLIFRGARYSFFLLMIFAIPIIFETKYILTLWLKNVPEYTIVFVRLSLLYTLIQSWSQTLYTSMLATGKIRDYQIVVCGIGLLTFPLAYLFFHFGYAPNYAYVASIFIAFACLFARLYMLWKMIKLKVQAFLVKVIIRTMIVCILSSILPYIIRIAMYENFLRLFIVMLTMLVCSILCIYYIGIDKPEKDFFRFFVKSKTLSLFKKS